jgi:hypothetical protein
MVIFSPIPELKATNLRDIDELLSLGETLSFFVKLQNCSDFAAYLTNTKVAIEYENGKPAIIPIEQLQRVKLEAGECVYFDVTVFQGNHYASKTDETIQESDRRCKLSCSSSQVDGIQQEAGGKILQVRNAD